MRKSSQLFSLGLSMSAKLILGKEIADEVKEEIKQTIQQNLPTHKTPPGLAVIQVGKDEASSIYVRNKRLACEYVGIRSEDYDLPSDVSKEELTDLIDELNHKSEVHGILLQLPLPSHLPSKEILERIHPDKDVDGFHPYNIGRLAQRRPILRPCTPYGIMKIFETIQYDVKGKDAVIVGASNVVGRPMALELLMGGATITVCHRFTHNLEEKVRTAECLIVACGIPNLIPGHWIKEGAIVIDVGINRLDSGKLCGDVDFKEAKKRAAFITPVPGGVGPMTVAMLLTNTLHAWEVAMH